MSSSWEKRPEDVLKVAKLEAGVSLTPPFSDATKMDEEEIENILANMKDWVSGPQGKSIVTAIGYVRNCRRIFQDKRKAIAVMACDEFRRQCMSEGLTVIQASSLRMFQKYFAVMKKPIPEPGCPAEQEERFNVLTPVNEPIAPEPGKPEPLEVGIPVPAPAPAPPGPDAVLDVTDDEYPEVDFSACPDAIRIAGSWNEKINGTYVQMTAASRGKPSWKMDGVGDHMFLYCRDGWKISRLLGSLQALVNAEDAGHIHPCEPYPKSWMHHRKVRRDGNIIVETFPDLGMRVMDARAPYQAVFDEDAKPKRRRDFTVNAYDLVVRRFGGKRKKRRKMKMHNVDISTLQAPHVVPGRSRPAQDAPSISSSASSSDVSGHGQSRRQGRKTSLQEEIKANAERSRKFLSKLVTELASLDSEGQQKRLELVKSGLVEKPSALAAAGLSLESLTAEFSDLATKLGIKGVFPETPPDPIEPQGELERLPHRWNLASRTALKQSSEKRNHDRHIVFEEPQSEAVTPIDSYRSLGEKLWFTMPGALVVCDGCDKLVPQTLGLLQGSPDRSQFSQSVFFCGKCTTSTSS